MIAGIQGPDGKFAGAAITWLAADGSDKAPVGHDTRRIYGIMRGGAVRLGSVNEMLVICEGIETGMSIAKACPDLPVWCALSAINLATVSVPPRVKDVIVAADGDDAGEKAALRAAMRLRGEGRRVRIARPATAKDFNDLLMEED
jgi:DNA primase